MVGLCIFFDKGEINVKIGIITYHRAYNYGAYLQAYALCSRLDLESDIDAEIIDFQMEKEIHKYNLPKSLKWRLAHPSKYRFMVKQNKSFIDSRKLLKCSEFYCQSDNIKDFNQLVYGKYDVIIAGSDEIWKVDGFRGFPTPYWLIGALGCRKFSYAASSRVNFSTLSKEHLNSLKDILIDFELISVRDKVTYNEVIKYYDQSKVLLSCDPSFLYDFKSNGDRGRALLQERYRIKENKKIIAVMTEDDMVASKIKKGFQKDSELISLFHWHKGYHNIAELNPFEWLDVISGVDFVFTSYFHAVCFSIVNNTPFMAFGTNLKSSKLEELLNNTICENRYIYNPEKFFQDKLWLFYLKEYMKKEDFSDFVIEKRKGFDEYLKYLRQKG